MRFFWKNTQTLIGSSISNIVSIITRNKPKGQVIESLVCLVFVVYGLWFPLKAHAVYDPTSVPNNRFGIHIIQATPDESSPSATLVNSSGGDWGYITFLIEAKDRNHDKWQQFFNDLRERHLIPIVRLATEPEGNNWKRPYAGEEQAWADFLDNLNWPTKNRYIVVYNEPNQAHEWGGSVDPKSYAEDLDKTITALKNKNSDFFVLNAGLDASAPYQPPQFMDEVTFLQQMQQAVPGIFDKLDGWVSHSYPNPGFEGSPDASGRGTVRTWAWEKDQLGQLGTKKDLPVFITETGWKHAEGSTYDFSLPDSQTVSKYFEKAFSEAWNDSHIVAVTPFLLSYQEKLFDHFSFKKLDGTGQTPGYYPQYDTILALSKTSGKPIQENKAQLTQGEIFSSIVAGETYNISLRVKNTGQSIWNDSDNQIRLVPTQGGAQLGIQTTELPKDIKVKPGEEYTFNVILRAPQSGSFKVTLNLFAGQKEFESQPFEFTTEVKSPVILQIKSALKWKKTYTGEYFLRVEGAVGQSIQKINLDSRGNSAQIEARYLLPDYTFNFTLEKDHYKSITISKKLYSGLNLLDFGTMDPDLMGNILNPKELWQLLPFSN